MLKRLFFSVISIICSLFVAAQEADLHNLWPAMWITVPDIDPQGYGVYEFKKEVSLEQVPKQAIVHVTGDNRYKFFVNGQLVSLGPSRSDMHHWNYETVDIAPQLRQGKNEVKAIVWNEGAQRAEANMSAQTAFLLYGEGEMKVLTTNDSWLCTQSKAYSPKGSELSKLTYVVTGPGERVDMNQTTMEWEKALILTMYSMPKDAVANLVAGSCTPWLLQPSLLQQRELNEEHTLGFKRLTVPAHTKKTILLDNKVLTNAYLNMQFSKGKDSHITLAYQEALYSEYPHKGNRNETDGKKMIGREDEVISNGQDGQRYTTLTFRTYRYVQLTVETADEPLTIDDVYGTATGYPFELRAKLNSDGELQDFLTIGWRTAKLCTWETYTDCPYYEQLQYLGDSRIQMLVTLYNVGDDAFIRNYLNLANESRNVEGVTQSRYPARTPQYIQPYALHYIWSLHDYMMYAQQRDFIANKLMSERSILDYFHHFQMEDGRLKNLPGWNFTDWVDGEKSWVGGICLPLEDGATSVMDLQLLYAYQMAAELERELGLKELAAIYDQRATQLGKAIEAAYWDETRGLYADHSIKDTYSQHANALAIITGLAKGERAKKIAQALESDKTLAPASIYFKYYVHQAMIQAGLGNHYLSWLDKWRENIRMGLTTWGETSNVDETRSDCHAWGASPNIEIFRTILGIDSDAPGFTKVKIAPHLGDIEKIGGGMPHPNGTIKVDYQRNKNKLTAVIILPEGTTGTFIWAGREYSLTTGINNIVTK